MSEDCQVCGQPIYDSEVVALRARVAKLEAAVALRERQFKEYVERAADDEQQLRARVAQLEAVLNDLRPNVDYHGHKKLDAAEALGELDDDHARRQDRSPQAGDRPAEERLPEADRDGADDTGKS